VTINDKEVIFRQKFVKGHKFMDQVGSSVMVKDSVEVVVVLVVVIVSLAADKSFKRVSRGLIA